MRCLVVVCLVCGLLLSATAMLHAQDSRTELMQQSHHKQRTESAKKAQVEAGELPTLPVTEPASAGYDYLVLLLLAASVVILAFVAGKRRRARLRY